MGEAKQKREAGTLERIVENPLGQFVILHSRAPLAWSGSRWVMAVNGLAIGGVQICNFKTAEEALEYVKSHAEEIRGAAATALEVQLPTEEGPNHWKDPAPDANAFRCPHCGKWRPGYTFQGQLATLPGMGTVNYISIFCSVCKVLLHIQVLSTLEASGMPSGLPPDWRRRSG